MSDFELTQEELNYLGLSTDGELDVRLDETWDDSDFMEEPEYPEDDFPPFYPSPSRRAVTTAERKPCGGPLPDECACGCSAYGERCDYWMECYRSGVEVDDDHRCCKVRRDR